MYRGSAVLYKTWHRDSLVAVRASQTPWKSPGAELENVRRDSLPARGTYIDTRPLESLEIRFGF